MSLCKCRKSLVAALVAILLSSALFAVLTAEDAPSARKRQRSRETDLRAQQRTGVLIPLYVYPANILNNPDYNRLLELKRRHETVPVWVIVNPASGPGTMADSNYLRAIDRLVGAGCIVLGYVTTSYAKRREADIRQDIDTWGRLYPRVHGIFFDEMINEDKSDGARFQAAVNEYAHSTGFWPTVANPGSATPRRYFESEVADVIVIHEGNSWPREDLLKGNDTN